MSGIKNEALKKVVKQKRLPYSNPQILLYKIKTFNTGLHYAFALCHHQLLSPFVSIIKANMELFLQRSKCFLKKII